MKKLINFTPAFIGHIQKVIKDHSELCKEESHWVVVLDVIKDGCSGQGYVFSVNNVETGHEKFATFLKDKNIGYTTTFDLFLTETALEVLCGSTFDYVRNQGSLLENVVITNPNIVNQCGCGKSFSIDKE